MSVLIRTSLTHPLQIAGVQAPDARGQIGITFCPGKKQAHAMSGAWDRDLMLDLDAIAAWGASAIVTLIELQEIEALRVTALGREAEARGIAWLHMPITDVSAPDERFEAAWAAHGDRLLDSVRRGQKVLVHSKRGLGRAGTVAALMLSELGLPPDAAIEAVRAARRGAIETAAQVDYVHAQSARPKPDTVLAVGAEGGHIRLVRRQGSDGQEFRVQASEGALSAGGPNLAVPARPWVTKWEEALAQLDSYPWVQLDPLEVHHAFRGEVAIALKRRTAVAQAVDWRSWRRVLGMEGD